MDDDNIVFLDNQTTLDIPPERVINGALEANLKAVVIVGWDEQDNLYLATSPGSNAESIYLLELAKRGLLDGAFR